jgi:D-glycero-alpha-D-manno-heptose 1-phosphate guanylyltransferase
MTTLPLLDCIILAGGKGTRLAGIVTDVPKPLASVQGRPFLDYVLSSLAASGEIHRVVLALGHLAGKVTDHYNRYPPVLPLCTVVEREPLGTGGALLNALGATTGDTLFALNGDSIIALDWSALLARHRASGASATLALVRVADTARYGSIILDGNQVVSFAEKQSGSGLINAGMYVLSRSLLVGTPARSCSFEHDLLPDWVARGLVAGLLVDAPLLDIGIPETYAAAPAFLATLKTFKRQV